MNHKIEALAELAGLEMCRCGCGMPTRQTAKFAELIVRECCNIVQEYESPHCHVDGMINDIKSQFGVEE